MVITSQVDGRQLKRVQRAGVGEIEHPVEVGGDLPQLAGEQVLDAKALAFGLARDLGDHARRAGTDTAPGSCAAD